MRLDAYLLQEGHVPSRARAQALIESGAVSVSGRVVTKSSYSVKMDDEVLLLREDHPYVSRAALKLKEIFDFEHVDLNGATVIDVGASTGGFTEICLAYGAHKVYAVDVGTDQLHRRLLDDDRVVNLQRTDARSIVREMFDPLPTVLVSDVSFISQTKVLPHVLTHLIELETLYILIKPQFELSPEEVERGIVSDPALHQKACESVTQMLGDEGFTVTTLTVSPITGSEGNVEFLCKAVRDV